VKILYLCQRLPFPPDRGDRIVTFNQIRHLCKKHQVTVGCLNHEDMFTAAKTINNEFDVKWVAPDHSLWPKTFGMAACLLARKPLTLGYFNNKDLHARITDLIDNDPPDLVIVFSSSMAQYVTEIESIPRIMHFCDLDSQKWKDLAERCKGITRWIYDREGRLLLEYERRIAAEFSACCVVTEHEAELFRRIIPGIPVHILENGVDTDYFSAFPRQPEEQTLLFVGVMDYAPNVEAVTYFTKTIWPTVTSARPNARFRIVGSRPAKAVRKLAKIRGIEVTGYVADIRPYLCSSTMLVAPLEIARGIQNKILEAMASGLPVLTTPAVAKGLPQGAESQVFVEEREPSRFASAVLELIDNPGLREQRSASARDYIQRYCTWELKLQALDELLDKVVADGRKRRHHANAG